MGVNGIGQIFCRGNTAVNKYHKSRAGQFCLREQAAGVPVSGEGRHNTSAQAVYEALKTNHHAAAPGRAYADYQSENYTLKADNENQCVSVFNADGEKMGTFFYADLKVRKDQATGTELLLSSFGTGAGMYDVIPMDGELKADLKEMMGVEKLETEALSGYQVKTHAGTGIQYVLRDGAEGYGGRVLLRNEADAVKYEALAEEYCRKYPNLVPDPERGRIYASFEICGMAERTQSGIVMIAHDNISYNDNENGTKNWSAMLTGNTWEALYDWLEKHRGQIEDMRKFRSWQDIFNRIGGSYERIWSEAEERQGYLNN